MKIGVSGASGHLGRATVAELVQRTGGHEVVAAKECTPALRSKTRFFSSRGEMIGERLDIGSEMSIRKAMQDHLAAACHPSPSIPFPTTRFSLGAAHGPHFDAVRIQLDRR